MDLIYFLLFCAFETVGSVFVPKLNFRIINNDYQCGVEASPNLIHQNPWLVYLEYYDRRGAELSIRCGATLVTSRHLVTAAHCVKKALFHRLTARLGEYDLNTQHDCVHNVCADPVVRINVMKIHTAPGFDGVENDIAILELERDAPYTDFIRPICLPTSKPPAVLYTASGWGEQADQHIYSHIKKIIPLPSWSTENCRKAYRNLKLPRNIICAGGEEGIDTCRGDSGGPLMLAGRNVELWGVTSSGNVKCGTEGSPGIYTSVVEYLDWIKEVIYS